MSISPSEESPDVCQMRKFTVIIVLENHFQTVRMIPDANHLITLFTEADHQNKEIHKISHNTDIVDQVVEIISIELTIHDQTKVQTKTRFSHLSSFHSLTT